MSEPQATSGRKDLSGLRIDRSEQPTSHRRMPAWLVVVVLLIGVAAVALPLLSRFGAFTPKVRVAPALVERAPTGGSMLLAASGYVVARKKAAVSAKTAGRLRELNVEEGSQVAEGDIIARLENDALAAEVQAARATLAQAEASVSRALAESDLARVELERQHRLMEAGLGTRSAEDTATATGRSRNASLREAKALVAASRARVDLAEVGLENTNVRAPFSGVVLRKEAEVGEYVAPSVASGSLTRGAIVTMADLTSLEVETDIAEANVARLIANMPAEITLDAVPDRRYRGRLRQVMPTADRQRATVQVKVTLLDPDDRVKPEMSAKVSFLSAEPDPAALQAASSITVPGSSLIVMPGMGAVAFAVEDGRVRRVSVVPGERRGERVVVTSGLVGTETLVLSPGSDLKDGDAVEVLAK